MMPPPPVVETMRAEQVLVANTSNGVVETDEIEVVATVALSPDGAEAPTRSVLTPSK